MRICRLAVALILALRLSGQEAPAQIDRAFERLYNFDFETAYSVLGSQIAANPTDPLPHAVRASALLFQELERLGILESEFFADDRRIADKKKLSPDPKVRAQLYEAISAAQARANALLAASSSDRMALFALCMVTGVNTDYMAFVEKRQIRSLSSAKLSNSYAQQLLRIDPQFHDAHLTTGLSEYILGSLPFFVRWFVRFENVEGDKQQGLSRLRLVAEQGRYMRAFAKVLLSVANLREKNPREAARWLAELTREYPQNPLFRRELDKLTPKLKPIQ